MTTFKDHFSSYSRGYLDFRPRYPQELFHYLANLSSEKNSVWDVGTGNGQAASELAKLFGKVVATDPSEKQLAEALDKDKISYRLGTAENPPLDADEKFNLITVAQAFHWFKHDQFAQVVKAHSTDNTHLVAWSYALAFLTPAVDEVVMKLYDGVLHDYWDPERRHVEDGYKQIPMPFQELKAPDISMSAEWELKHLVGYLSTWSSSQKFLKKNGVDPVEKIFPELEKAWGSEKSLTIRWPLNMRVWKV